MPDIDDFVQPPLATPNGTKEVGKVYLVGAGPGDPGLITVRGLECLKMADFVLYDGLTNAGLLDFAARATCFSVGKHGTEPIWSQTEINLKMVELARQGKIVVRLKGGDPAVFARTAEELEVLSNESIPFEVVPGITAALAAASYVGIPITHRDHASAVALITGQQQSDATEIDWASLARFPGTIVFYMGVTTVAKWSNQLIGAGKSPNTPAAIIRRCTWSDQSVYRCRLDEVADFLTPSTKMRPPVIVIIGAVAALGKNFDWFSSRPLMGCGVLITRAAEQSGTLAERLRSLGAEIYLQPVIEVVEPSDRTAIETAVQELADQKYDGVTFSSANGVDGLFTCVNRLGLDSRIFAKTKIAVVGAHTAERLEQFGLKADIVPDAFSASDLLNALPQNLAGQRWLVTCTNRSRDTLTRGLAERGASVNEVVVYETRNVERLKPGVESALKTSRIQWVTVTSGAIAENAHRLLKEFTTTVKPISLSDSISDRLIELKWPPVAQAAEHSIESLIDAMLKANGTN